MPPMISIRPNASLRSSKPTPWPQSKGPRLAAVSSFGLSGTNAHVVLEEYRQAEVSDDGVLPALLTLSAKSPQALRDLAGRMAVYLENNEGVSLADFCWTLAAGRAHFGHRLALVANSAEQVKDALAGFAAGEKVDGVRTKHTRRTTAPSRR